jgi:hypothetical protein
MQHQHAQEAARNPALAVRANGGHPAIAATPRPAAFNAPGVVGAHGAAAMPVAARTPGQFAQPNGAQRAPGQFAQPNGAQRAPGQFAQPNGAQRAPGQPGAAGQYNGSQHPNGAARQGQPVPSSAAKAATPAAAPKAQRPRPEENKRGEREK